MSTYCIPGAHVLDVSPEVSPIQKGDGNIGAVVLHTGLNDIRMRQSEILKSDFRSLIEEVRRTVHLPRRDKDMKGSVDYSI